MTDSNERDHTIYRTISFSDLESVGYKVEIEREGDKIKVGKVTKHGGRIEKKELFEAIKFLGVKLNNKLSIEEKCDHTTLQGNRVTNFRIVGEERSDRKWITSGFASDEAKMNSSRMGGMVDELSRLSGGGGMFHG